MKNNEKTDLIAKIIAHIIVITSLALATNYILAKLGIGIGFIACYLIWSIINYLLIRLKS